jgi:hypothetical protein
MSMVPRAVEGLTVGVSDRHRSVFREDVQRSPNGIAMLGQPCPFFSILSLDDDSFGRKRSAQIRRKVPINVTGEVRTRSTRGIQGLKSLEWHHSRDSLISV